jgi:segregation and condensation protein A
VALVDLELDLDVFAGPFDLLLTLILRAEVDLLEVDLADVVITYIDHLERRGLLELKSRLLLPGEELEELELEPGEAAEELLARLLAAHRYRAAASHLRDRLEDEQGYRFRSAPLPPQLRLAPLHDAHAVYAPAVLATAIGGLLQVPPPVDVRHMTVAKVTVAERLAHLRAMLARGRFTFSDAVGPTDRVTVAVTLYALLELYKQGEATWTQDEPFGEIVVSPAAIPVGVAFVNSRHVADAATARERVA